MDRLCGNKQQYNDALKWIQNVLSKTQITQQKLCFDHLLFIAGNSGIGKTHSVRAICEHLDLFIVNITTTNCGSSADLNDLMTKALTSSMIQTLTNNKQQKIIVIDEFESMMTIDRTINTTLYNILNAHKLRAVPIICVISADMVKRIGPIKKKCKIIELDMPTDQDIAQLLQGEYPEKAVDDIKQACADANGNISQCLKKLHSQQNINDNMDENLHIDLLYSSTFNRDRTRKLLSTDPWLMPLKYHENLIKELQNRKMTIQKSKDHYRAFMNDLIYFDHMMCNNAMDIGIECFTSMTGQLADFAIKKNAISRVDNFTKMLSYLSLQKKNVKKSYSSHVAGRNNVFLK